MIGLNWQVETLLGLVSPKYRKYIIETLASGSLERWLYNELSGIDILISLERPDLRNTNYQNISQLLLKEIGSNFNQIQIIQINLNKAYEFILWCKFSLEAKLPTSQNIRQNNLSVLL